ncbi:MAG: hypothetical protein M0D57_04795 [Sphingobacteriales bacterium JAD_PAG50586_3]|nr:MAG: hypothetical protein M0D57_04795 [Sphingobacteriales bacterium JAD_PAG50586_3]
MKLGKKKIKSNPSSKILDKSLGKAIDASKRENLGTVDLEEFKKHLKNA